MRTCWWSIVWCGALAACTDRGGRDSAVARGPVDEAALFAALDPSLAELSAVFAAFESGDLDVARGALAEHLRTRASPWTPASTDVTVDDAVVAEAERVARGEVELVGVAHGFPAGDVDWTFNATRDRDDVPFNRQWGNHLNRTRFWRPLADAYRWTGEERYASAWVEQLRDFLTDNPFDPTADTKRRPAWKTLITASRMKDTWPDLLHTFRASPSVTDDDLIVLLRSFLEHGRHLRANHDDGLDNHLAVEMRGLHTVGCLFPEFVESADWRRHAIETAARSVPGMFYPDGASKELSPGYHHLSVAELWTVAETARAFGHGDEVSGAFVDALAPAVEAMIHLMTPERTLPSLNDSGTPSVIGALGDKLGRFPFDDEARWVVTEGAEGGAPETTSCYFDWAGWAVMRSGWERDATYAVFDVGPLGTDHVHQDKLNLVVWAYGRELLFDNGGGSYEESDWREYGADTHSHNAVLVDGLGQRRVRKTKADRESTSPIDADWQVTPDEISATAAYVGGWGDDPREELRPESAELATHRRTVRYFPPDVFLVIDDLASADGRSHHYELRWNLRTENVAPHDAYDAVATADQDQPNLLIVPVGDHPPAVTLVKGRTGASWREFAGWDLGKRGEPARETITVCHELRGDGHQRFATLLVALPAGDRPGARVTAVDGGVRVDRPGGAMHIRVTGTDVTIER